MKLINKKMISAFLCTLGCSSYLPTTHATSFEPQNVANFTIGSDQNNIQHVDHFTTIGSTKSNLTSTENIENLIKNGKAVYRAGEGDILVNRLGWPITSDGKPITAEYNVVRVPQELLDRVPVFPLWDLVKHETDVYKIKDKKGQYVLTNKNGDIYTMRKLKGKPSSITLHRGVLEHNEKIGWIVPEEFNRSDIHTLPNFIVQSAKDLSTIKPPKEKKSNNELTNIMYFLGGMGTTATITAIIHACKSNSNIVINNSVNPN